MTLTDFLLARIAEDEIEACAHTLAPHSPHSRELARCAADRRIVESMGDDWVTRTLAIPYTDHPDYREEWRP